MKPVKAALVVALTATTLTITTPDAPTTSASAAKPSRPNVVFILTDDMRKDDLRYMPFTRRFFRKNGTVFTHALSPHPVCCPARAELTTGQYAQNNGVWHNIGPFGGYAALKWKDRMIFRWFRQRGYRTAYFGKVLNHYYGDYLPGLVHNDAAIDKVYAARNVVTYNNGNPRVRKRHQTHYVTNQTNRLIRRWGNTPFFIWTGYVAPHTMTRPKGRWRPPIPPRGYRKFRRPGHRRPQSFDRPSFNAPVDWEERPELSAAGLQKLHGWRVRSLYAVDDSVRRIVRTLRKKGELDNTVLVFTSDNGMGMGAHRLRNKNEPYQDMVRVPLLMSGPGVPSKAKRDEVATLVDLPVTLSGMAGATPMLTQDGADLFGLPDDRAVLIQGGDPEERWDWRGVYTRRYTYVRYRDGQVEFYDRDEDPQELQNLPGHELVPEMQALLESLENCSGAQCSVRGPS